MSFPFPVRSRFSGLVPTIAVGLFLTAGCREESGGISETTEVSTAAKSEVLPKPLESTTLASRPETTTFADRIAALDEQEASPQKRFEREQGLYRAWADSDPAVALEDARLRLSPLDFDDVAHEILSRWIKSDPAAVTEHLEGRGKSLLATPGAERLLRQLAREDMSLALDLSRDLQSPEARSHLLGGISEILARDYDVEGSQQWIDSNLKGREKQRFSQAFVRSLAEIEPEAAVLALADITDPDLHARTAILVAETWSERDPERSIGWIESLPNSPLRERLYQSALESYARASPTEALGYFETLGKSAERNQWAEIAIGSLVEDDPGAALEWIGRQDEELTTALEFSAMGRWSEVDPASALASLREDPARFRHSAAHTRLALESLADRDPEAAVREIDRLSSLLPPSEATAVIADRFFEVDPQAAREWFETIPADRRSDSLQSSRIRALGQESPASAFEELSAIENVGTRGEVVEEIFAYWMNRDPEAIIGLVRESAIDFKTKGRLLDGTDELLSRPEVEFSNPFRR